MTGIDLYGDLTGTGRILRTHPVDENTRGPDSVECQPFSGTHQACWYNYLTFGPVHGFLCGCVCHDQESSGPETEAPMAETTCETCKGRGTVPYGGPGAQRTTCPTCTGSGTHSLSPKPTDPETGDAT